MTSSYWIIVTALFIGIFFAPIHGGDSTVTVFLDAVDRYYAGESLSMSLP